jgi:hypothetical protein
MKIRLAANGNRFTTLVEAIVNSPQFRNKRSPEAAEQPPVLKGERKGG